MACSGPACLWNQCRGPARRCHIQPCPPQVWAGTHHLCTGSSGPVQASPKHMIYPVQMANAALSALPRWQIEQKAIPVSCSPSSLLPSQQQTVIFSESRRDSAQHSLSTYIRSLPPVSSGKAGPSSGPLPRAVPLANASRLLATSWHQTRTESCFWPLRRGLWRHDFPLPQEGEKKSATTERNPLYSSSLSISTITLGFAKSGIPKILLFHLYCPDFLFCQCKLELVCFATSSDNIIGGDISALLKGLSHCKLKRAQTYRFLENIITSAVSTDH